MAAPGLLRWALAWALLWASSAAWYKHVASPRYHTVGRASGLLMGVRRSPYLWRRNPPAQEEPEQEQQLPPLLGDPGLPPPPGIRLSFAREGLPGAGQSPPWKTGKASWGWAPPWSPPEQQRRRRRNPRIHGGEEAKGDRMFELTI